MRILLRISTDQCYDYVIAFIRRLTVHLHPILLTVTSMYKSSFTKARRRFRRNRFLMHPQKFLILPLVMIFYVLFMQKRNATHSPDPFSAKRYFPGWKIHPAVFVSADNPQVDDSGPL